MVFTVDIGNTNIVLGAFDGDELSFESRISTDPSKMEDQYAIEFSNIISLYGFSPKLFDGAIISSVVPPLLPLIKRAVRKLLNCKVLTIGPGIKTGLNIKIDNPAALGSDLVCCAVAAMNKYKMPCVIFDLGTATTITALDANGGLLGGSIYPGVKISLDALSTRTAQLPYINTEPIDSVIGTNTIESMRSGILYGTAGMIDGMVERYSAELGGECVIVATGGFANTVVPYCKSDIKVDNTLLLEGLYQIYKKNCSE